MLTWIADVRLWMRSVHSTLQCSLEHRKGIPLREDDGWWRLRADGLPLPLLFTLRATRPGDTR